MKTREEVKYNPIDFEVDRAIGLTLPLTNDAIIAQKFSLGTSWHTGSASEIGVGGADVAEVIRGTEKEPGGFHLSYTTKEQAASNIRNLVLTTKGERVMHPEFGCNIYGILFEHSSKEMIGSLKKRIEDQVKLWLPYINLLDVRIDDVEDNKLAIAIDFALYNNTMDRETIVIDVRNL